MARALGIDYGIKRTGISVTDPLKLIVNGLTTISTEELMAFIREYLKKEPVDLIVFGDPYHKDGKPTELNSIIHGIGKEFSDLHPHVKIDFQNESYTSQQAIEKLIQKGTPKNKRSKEAIDQMSAVLILQKYLNHY